MNMKYSFVLPAYKARFFREALDSILNQTYKDFELIIVNDASPENLDVIVNSYNDSRIRYYVNEENIGGKDLVAQWNHCLEYATGEFIILASDDDVYHIEYLEKMNVLVDKYPNVNVFRPRIKWIDYNGETTCIDRIYKNRMTQVEFSVLRFKREISSGIPFHLFRTKALKDIGGFVSFPTAWFSDDATVIKLSKNDIIITNEVLFSFRNSGINISSSLNNRQMLYNKIVAAEQFHLWLLNELYQMTCYTEEEIEHIKNINEFYLYRRNDHIIQQLQHSIYNKSIITCWRFLNEFNFLRYIDIIKILYRIFVKKR